MKVEYVKGDILEQKVDCIVNPWNQNIPFLKLNPQGLSGKIRIGMGVESYKKLKKFGYMPVGKAVITDGGNLSHKFKYIIHVAGIQAIGWKATKKSVTLSVKNALKLCEQHEIKSIAFPLIGAGHGKMVSEKSKEYINDILDEHKNMELEVYVVEYEGN